MAQPFLKLPIVAKLGKPGRQFDDAGVRARMGFRWWWWGVYHSENGRAKTGYYGGSTPCAFSATTGEIIGYSC
jgi:hypothetical protein